MISGVLSHQKNEEEALIRSLAWTRWCVWVFRRSIGTNRSEVYNSADQTAIWPSNQHEGTSIVTKETARSSRSRQERKARLQWIQGFTHEVTTHWNSYLHWNTISPVSHASQSASSRRSIWYLGSGLFLRISLIFVFFEDAEGLRSIQFRVVFHH